MRELIIEIERQRINNFSLAPRGVKGIPVGAEGVDYQIKADVLMQLSHLVGSGMPLKMAVEHAKGYARSLIRSHNARRKDINWQRWEGLADTALENIERFAFQLYKNCLEGDPML